jgi:4-amino-4-deoxychorismate lyase
MSGALGSWIDGVAGDVLPADDRGLHYGDGVFETILVRAGKPRFLEAHLARLTLGCTRLAIPIASMPALRAEIASAAASAPALAVIKVIITRGSAQRRGYAPQGNEAARRLVSLWPSPARDPALDAGVDIRVADMRLAENPVLAGIKHLNRLENVLASAESARHGAFESLMRDHGGNVISGAMSNVFIARAGNVITPVIQRCGVAGVMRGIVLRECAALGIAAMEDRLTLDELLAADEAFITNARIGVVPVRRVGEHSFGMKNLASRLAAHIEALDA